jgi:hypothetical protein
VDLVRYAKQHPPAALVRQRYAVIHQLFKVKVVGRLLELQVFILGADG